jgi:hypothetical protein
MNKIYHSPTLKENDITSFGYLSIQVSLNQMMHRSSIRYNSVVKMSAAWGTESSGYRNFFSRAGCAVNEWRNLRSTTMTERSQTKPERDIGE